MSNTKNSSGLKELIENDKFISTPSGYSMSPLFRDRENAVEIVRAEHPLKKYDMAMYVSESGKTILHRIMEVGKDSYVFCGDNNVKPEIVPFDKVVGVATRFYRKGRWISVNDKSYQRYVKVWCGLFPIRKYILKARGVMSKAKSILKVNK